MHRRGFAESHKKGRAAGCVAFLVKAMKLAQKTSLAFVEIKSAKWMVNHRVSKVLACGTDQKWFYLCP